MDSSRVRQVRERLGGLPRVRLAHLPTPLDRCDNLSRALDGVPVSVKRDDCTGLAFGGNKTRQLEYVLGHALAGGADCVIQGAASQSNHSRQLAAAGARLGLDVFLTPRQDRLAHPVQGNHLVDHLLGATLVPVAGADSTVERKQALAAELRAAGRRPYVIGMGAHDSLVRGAVAYVDGLIEIVEACPPGAPPRWIFVTSQASTQAGLLLGCKLLGLADIRVVGVNPMAAGDEAYVAPADIARIAADAAALLGCDTPVDADEVVNLTDYVGDGYGLVSDAGLAAARLAARTEGLLLDPVYTAKGFAGLLDHVARGQVTAGQPVTFVHTGGLPALFAYADQLLPEPAERPTARRP